MRRAGQADLAGNRQRGAGMIAGRHDRADADCLHFFSAPLTSGRGGSWSPTRPAYTSSCSGASRFHDRLSGRQANANTRRPCLAIAFWAARPCASESSRLAAGGRTAASPFPVLPCNSESGPPASRGPWTCACGRHRRESRRACIAPARPERPGDPCRFSASAADRPFSVLLRPARASEAES